MQTMTDGEKAIMREHSAYWQGFAQKGWAVAYGPVAAASGGYGAGFWALPDDIDPRPLTDNDPAIGADVGFQYEIHPVPVLIRGSNVAGQAT